MKYRKLLICIGVLTVLDLTFSVAFPYVNGKFVDYLVLPNSYRNVVFWALIILAVGSLNAITTYAITCITKMVNENVYFDIRNFLMEHFRKISILKYRQNNASHLNKRIDMNITRIITFFLDNYILFFAQMIQILIIFIIVYSISWEILLGICIILPIYWWVYIHFKTPIFHDSMLAREKSAELYQAMNEELEYMEDIIIEANYDMQDSVLKNKFMKYYDAAYKYTKTLAKFKFSQGIFAVFFQVMVFLLGGYLVINGKMTVGKLTMITTYFSLIMNAISYYVEFAKNYQISKSSIVDMNTLFDIPQEVEGNRTISNIRKINAKLNFSYTDGGTVVLDKKLQINSGECVGIIGINGSGKTTLSKLLIGSLKGNNGSIIYNNQFELSEINSVELRNSTISYIPQKIRHINMPISDIFNEIGAYSSICDLLKAFDKLNIQISNDVSGFIRNVWGKNLDDLSGGDKQLIIILKCLLKNSSMFIFDEPSSNLDKGRIAWLKTVINELKRNKIVLIISHDKDMFDVFDRTISLG